MEYPLSLESIVGNNTSTSPLHNTTDPSDNAPGANVSKIDVHSYFAPGTVVATNIIPWHTNPPGKSHEKDQTLYNSWEVTDAQAADMKSRGIDVVIISWQGAKQDNKELAAYNMLKSCEKYGLKFMIMVDGSALKWVTTEPNKTKLFNDWINFCRSRYFTSPAYYKDATGKPVVMEFIDFTEVPVDLNQVNINGTYSLICRNKTGAAKPHSSGAYAWINNGISYLKDFYAYIKANPKGSNWGSVFKGFNDTTASWSPLYSGGAARILSQNNGQTFLDTITLFKATGLKLVALNTWNDYEEGTALECGIDAKLDYTASITERGFLGITVKGNLATIHHIEFFLSEDGQNFAKLEDKTLGADGITVIDTMKYVTEPGQYKFLIKIVGQPCFVNKHVLVSSTLGWYAGI